ncbi:unnamed protein product [Rhizophagus irregularis]|uniref:HTH CENPB-type domain-containing protein n=1 Tax=Rhizophagus irregularis TaxID=588596 RepID=A0A916DXL4_9GLOM|nr:unnamed protein product [Rhizophagus irregularis]
MRENKDTNNKKKKSLTLAQKKEFCEKQRDQKLNEHWLSIDATLPNANNFCEKSSVYLQLEEVMSIWVDQQISRNLTINGPIIQQKAVEEIICIHMKKKGEADSAPIDELLQMRAELREILQAYELKDIWNCDETALFWHLESFKTIAHDPVKIACRN